MIVTLKHYYGSSVPLVFETDTDWKGTSQLSANASREFNGFYSTVRDANSVEWTLGYFAEKSVSENSAPKYEEGLWLLIGARLAKCDEFAQLSLKRGLWTRKLQFSCPEFNESIEYEWPIQRELILNPFADQFGFVSQDFCFELHRVVKFYCSGAH